MNNYHSITLKRFNLDQDFDVKTDFYFVAIFGIVIYLFNLFSDFSTMWLMTIYFWIVLSYKIIQFLFSRRPPGASQNEYSNTVVVLDGELLEYSIEHGNYVGEVSFSEISEMKFYDIKSGNYLEVKDRDDKCIFKISFQDLPNYKISVSELNSMYDYFDDNAEIEISYRGKKDYDSFFLKVFSRKFSSYLDTGLNQVLLFTGKVKSFFIKGSSAIENKDKEFSEKGICIHCGGENNISAYICKWCNNHQINTVDHASAIMQGSHFWGLWTYVLILVMMWLNNDNRFHAIVFTCFGVIYYLYAVGEVSSLPTKKFVELFHVSREKNKKRFRRFIVVCSILLFMMYNLRPTGKDFEEFSAEVIAEESFDSDILARLSGTILSSFINNLPADLLYEEYNLVFMSLFIVDTSPLDDEENYFVTVGVLGNFIPFEM